MVPEKIILQFIVKNIYFTCMQGCIKFLIIKSYGEEFQVVKRGREFKGFWEEYHVEKG